MFVLSIQLKIFINHLFVQCTPPWGWEKEVGNKKHERCLTLHSMNYQALMEWIVVDTSQLDIRGNIAYACICYIFAFCKYSVEVLKSLVQTCIHVSSWDYSSVLILAMLLLNIFLEWLLDILKSILFSFLWKWIFD